MKIAITADVHLTSEERNPERYHALRNILQQLVTLEIDQLIIAGDLFDSSCRSPGEFESLLSLDQYSKINVLIIPGNHDPALSPGSFTLTNINYIVKPQITEFSKNIEFVFLPYEENKSIGEVLVSSGFNLKPNKWILVAHGDNLASTRLRNEYESGLYMPISSRDIQVHQPRKVFLGHIHSPMDSDVVHYPGSPCGLNISETGIRSFLVYDTVTGLVERVPIETDVIYFKISLTVFPSDNEHEFIKGKLVQQIADWHLSEEQKSKAKLRVKVNGYSTNREEVLKTITDFLSQEKISLEDLVDLSELKLSNDIMRAEIASAVQDRILALDLIDDPDEPTRDDYLLSAMYQIYKG